MPSRSSGGQRKRSAITGHFVQQEHEGVTHMNTKHPRVTAGYIIESVDMRDLGGASEETPRIEVRVEFDLHDSEAALRGLDRAVESVRSQIKEAS